MAAGSPPAASPLEEALPAPVPGDAAAASRELNAALVSLKSARFDDALKLFEQAVAADPSHVAARSAYGWFLLDETQHHRQGEALRQFRTVRLLDRENGEAVAGEGIARQEVGDLERAEPLLRQALESLAPDHERRWQVCFSLGRLLSDSERGEQALALYDEALALRSGPRISRSRARVLVGKASCLNDLEREPEALQVVRQAVELDRSHVKAHYLLSRLLARSGDVEASRRFQRIHDILRETEEILIDADRKILLHRELVQIYPEHTRARFNLIRECLKERRYAEALEEVGLQASAAGVDGEVLYLSARAKAGLGDLPGARADHDRMRRLQPNIPQSVTRDVLDEWRQVQGIDAQTYAATLQEWLRVP